WSSAACSSDLGRLVIEGEQPDLQVRGAILGEALGGIDRRLLQAMVDRRDDPIAAGLDVLLFEARLIDEFAAHGSKQISLRTLERVFPTRVLHLRKLLLIAFRLGEEPGGDHEIKGPVPALFGE